MIKLLLFKITGALFIIAYIMLVFMMWEDNMKGE